MARTIKKLQVTSIAAEKEATLISFPIQVQFGMAKIAGNNQFFVDLLPPDTDINRHYSALLPL